MTTPNNVNGHVVEDVLYRPLSVERKEIRILRLEDHSPKTAEYFTNGISNGSSTPMVLSFKLDTVSLQDRIVPHFEAISYCWGDDVEKARLATIILNGRAVQVPMNAEAALRAICYRQGRWSVWLDAVCIDMEDKLERNRQVAIMSDIYAKATRCLVWLGDDKTVGESAIASIQALIRTLAPNPPERLKTPHSSSSKTPPLKGDPRKLGTFSGWPAIYSFFANRWFTRAWVIQEVCCSKSCFCYQGKLAIEFDEIANVATYLHERRHTLIKAPKKAALTGIENAATIWTLRRHKAQKLASLLRVVYTFNCSEPHDMVYSILGLRHKSAQKPESITRVIPIYEEPILEVYAKATKAAIAETKSLGILKHAHSLRGFVRRKGEPDDFPSWALRMDLRGHYHINPISYRNFRFNANGHIPLVLWTNDSSRVLRVQGVLVDKIIAVSDCMRWKQYGDAKTNDTLTAAAVLHETYAWANDVLPSWTTDSLTRTFSVTVAAGQDASGKSLAEDDVGLDRLHHGFKNMAHAPSAPPTDDEGDDTKSIDSRTSASTANSSRSIDVKDFDTDLATDNPDATYALAAMMKGGHHRTVYVTSKQAMGLGTDNVQPGDCVCILFGGSVPFVLRPENHYWRFIGDSYVWDIMHGEYIRSLIAQDYLEQSKQWFKIR